MSQDLPHDASWFNFFGFHDTLLENTRKMQAAMSPDGLSWYAQEEVGVQHVFGLLTVLAVLLFFGIRTYSQIKDTESAIIPEGKFSIRTFVELFTGYVYNQMASMMGKDAAKVFLPLIGTAAFVIFFSNLLGIMPFFPVPTTNFNTTIAFALVIFVATHIFGIKKHGFGYAKQFLGPFLPLAPLMLLIELISHIARPITLAIRLMANMAADHLVLGIFIGLVPFIVPLPIYALGCIVITVQTLVFCLLSTVYISMAIADDGH